LFVSPIPSNKNSLCAAVKVVVSTEALAESGRSITHSMLRANSLLLEGSSSNGTYNGTRSSSYTSIHGGASSSVTSNPVDLDCLLCSSVGSIRESNGKDS